MGSLAEKTIPNISANIVKRFLEKKGYKLDFDFRNAKLGNYIKGNYNPVSIENYHVAIACCSNNNKNWVCIATNSIPKDTCYIIECQPRANIINLWNLLDFKY
jgi:hypothetical protein